MDQANLRKGFDTAHFRQVDEIAEEFPAELQQTLVSSTDTADIMYEVKAVTTRFFREARGLYVVPGLDVASRLEAKTQQYFDSCGWGGIGEVD